MVEIRSKVILVCYYYFTLSYLHKASHYQNPQNVEESKRRGQNELVEMLNALDIVIKLSLFFLL